MLVDSFSSLTKSFPLPVLNESIQALKQKHETSCVLSPVLVGGHPGLRAGSHGVATAWSCEKCDAEMLS